MNRKAIVFVIACVGLGSLDVRGETRYIEPESDAVRGKLEWFQDQKLCLMMHFGWDLGIGGIVDAAREIQPDLISVDRVFATVLWGVADERCSRVFMPDAPELGEIVGMVHLASGRSLSFAHVVGDMENGVIVELPHDFHHDKHADSFAVDFKPLTQQIRDSGARYRRDADRLVEDSPWKTVQ